MTKKDYKKQNYYECPKCNEVWAELDDKITHSTCPYCEKERVDPFKTFENVLDWSDHYTPVENHIHPDEGEKFETYGEDLEYIKTCDPNHVWTVVDNDYGELSIGKGFHLVNRQYYIVTKESHENDNENYHY